CADRRRRRGRGRQAASAARSWRRSCPDAGRRYGRPCRASPLAPPAHLRYGRRRFHAGQGRLSGPNRWETAMILDVFSDTICPWCYVGKRRLQRALKARPMPGLSVRWRAFQLNPSMPAEGMDRRAYVEAKFGGPERARAIYEAVRLAGSGEGIDFAFDRIKRTPSTLQSHRLVRFAASAGRQEETLEAVFRAY